MNPDQKLLKKSNAVNFVIHWNETAMGLHVFPIPKIHYK